jgi:hypothetical protein
MNPNSTFSSRGYLGYGRHSMSDKDIIINSLERVERRIRTNRLFNELTFGTALFLAFPIVVKLWDLVSPIRGRTIAILGGLWAAVFIGYVVSRFLQKGTLSQAAASVDKRAGLHDEIKTAFWFIHNPRPSDWVDTQIKRAARNAQSVDLDGLYPRQIPRVTYIAAALILLFIGLNFVPLSSNHNWLALEAAPAFSLTPEEAAILKETEALLRQAEKLQQSELVQKLEEIVQQLQEGAIDAAQAAQMLEGIQSELDEGNLDMASITQGLEEIAQDFEQAEETQAAGQAMKNKELNEAAEELRKLAEKLDKGESMDDVQKSLEQASENQRPGLEELAKQLKEAAENLKKQNQEGAQEALEQVAQELDDLQEKMQSQDLKNMASQQIQKMQESLRQRQQGSQAKKNQQAQQSKGGEPQAGPPQDGEAGEQEAGEPQDQAGNGEGEPTDQEGGQEGQPGTAQESEGDGGGLMPSGKGGADGPREGAPTKLDVKLAQEKLEGMQDQGKQENIEEESKQERSRLDYRNVKSELSPAQKDLLNQDRIPWEYRPLIKSYFQAIRPTGSPTGKK